MVRKQLVGFVCLLAFSAGVALAEIKDVPAEVKTRPLIITQIIVKADSKVKVVNVYERQGVRIYRLHSDEKDAIAYLFQAEKPGTYTLGFFTADKDGPGDPRYCTVTVEGAVPVPPDPEPKPPDPSDPLTKAVLDAFRTEPAATRAQHAQALAAVYRQGVDAVDLPGVKTAGNLLAALRAVSNKMLPADALKSVRTVIQGELKRTLPSDPETVLSFDHKVAAKGLFVRIATALESLR